MPGSGDAANCRADTVKFFCGVHYWVFSAPFLMEHGEGGGFAASYLSADGDQPATWALEGDFGGGVAGLRLSFDVWKEFPADDPEGAPELLLAHSESFSVHRFDPYSDPGIAEIYGLGAAMSEPSVSGWKAGDQPGPAIFSATIEVLDLVGL